MKKYFAFFGLILFSIAAFAQGKIEFTERKHDFGSIKEDGGRVTHVFGFKNVGDEPLVITTVKTPCGCTSPKWSKSAVPAGKGGYIEATFDPMHRPGVFSKVLTVVTDGIPQSSYITIVGEVLPRKRTVEDHFPMVSGSLRYQMPQIYMGKVRTGSIDTAHVRIYNQGLRTIKLNSIDVPFHIKTKILTPEIAPKAYGKFVVFFDPTKRAELGMVTDQIMIHTDDDVAPEHTMYVVADIEQNIEVLTPKELEVAPKIASKDIMVDLGDVEEGDEVRGVFTLTNEGENVLRIIRLKPECGCTTTSITSDQIEKGKKAKVDLIFDATGYDGLVIKKIDVFSNDPLNPKYTLKMKAFVKAKRG